MPRLELTADDARRELAAFQETLGRGLGVLRRVGEARCGGTPRESIFTIDDVVLYRYGTRGMDDSAIPLLIVYALVNRPEMTDMQQGRSLIGALLARGFDVYLIDWGYPTSADRCLGLDDYVNRYIDACVDALRVRLARPAISLLGICQGGTLSICYAALNPLKVERLITTVTPIDFHSPDDMLSHLIRHVDIGQMTASVGNISGDFLNWLFLSLKPYRLTQQKYLDFLDRIDDVERVETFLRMDHWIFDSPALAAAAGGEFAHDFYQDNKLIAGQASIGGKNVTLAALTMPILNIFAREDHLVPPASAQALGIYAGTGDYTEIELAGGHIGIYVSASSSNSVSTAIAEWFGL